MSNISWHNYETYFLRYVDNELSDAERTEVYDFAQTHPDLQEELAILQQTVLTPDNIAFDGKNFLLVKENIPAHLQDKLLSHLDNELASDEKSEIEDLLTTDTNVKKEWALLQQTKLLPAKPEVFKYKRSLYRKEKGRVVALPWLRIAAAALLIGFGVWGGVAYLKKSVVIKTNDTAANSEHDRKTITPVVPSAIKPNSPNIIKKKEVVAALVNTKRISKKPTLYSPEKMAAYKATNKDMQKTALQAKNNNLAIPSFDNVNNNEGNKSIADRVIPGKQPATTVNPGNNDSPPRQPDEAFNSTYATTTSFTDNNEENNNRVLFMDEEKIKKTKLGGIFRKVKRVLERKANIKTGGDNNIKVANLEFAIQ